MHVINATHITHGFLQLTEALEFKKATHLGRFFINYYVDYYLLKESKNIISVCK
jgi:hypothetical protein